MRLFFLTGLAISVAPRLSRNPEMSVSLSTRTFVFSIHSLVSNSIQKLKNEVKKNVIFDEFFYNFSSGSDFACDSVELMFISQ